LSCDWSAGPNDLYSISRLMLPSPGVVVGDTMRDSLGNAAVLRLVAYARSGDTLGGQQKYFITLDTMAHLVGGMVLIGDHLGTARVIGGIGSLQTLPETVKVTLRPDTIVAADSAHHLKTYQLLTDSIANSAELSALVQNRAGGVTSTVDAVIVRYTIVSSPASKNFLPSVTIMNGNNVSPADTSSSGRVGRSLRLWVNRLVSVNEDSAVVDATASHRGASLGTIRFTVVFKSQ
jgi:hypothetical protein